MSAVEEKQSDKEPKTRGDSMGSMGPNVSDKLVSLVTAWVSFVKPRAGLSQRGQRRGPL